MTTIKLPPEGVSKKQVHGIEITFRGKRLGGVMWITTSSGETIIKPLTPAKAHLSWFYRNNILFRHVTHERYPKGSKRRHTQRRGLRPETIALTMLTALAPEDDPPPQIESFQAESQVKTLTDWFVRVFPRIVRKADDRPIVLLKGPLQRHIERAIFDLTSGRARFDLEAFIALQQDPKVGLEENAFVRAKETDLRPGGPDIGFVLGLTRVSVCLGQGFVFELDLGRFERATKKNFDLLGFEGVVRSLRRKGFSLLDTSVLPEFRESGPRDGQP